MEPKDAIDRVLAAGKQVRLTTGSINEGGHGTMATAQLGSGICVRLYCWTTGGDPDRPIEIAIGQSKMRIGFGEAAVLSEIIKKLISGWCTFEAGMGMILDEALLKAKDGIEN
jgi:hypothetical protein